MYFPDKYQSHNEALDRFVILFNRCSHKKKSRITMNSEKIENFRDDGFIQFPDNSILKYDFEKRFNYYPKFGEFRFSDLGQFERKISKKEISLSIQCSTDESGFVFAFHEDLYKEEKKYISSKTRNGYERTAKRFTKNFYECSSENIIRFHNMIENCYKNKNFSFNGCTQER
tara:strand:+ start:706 stop:1221 length:516 start_codon:yes stop_codon:yes gene_type:complete